MELLILIDSMKVMFFPPATVFSVNQVAHSAVTLLQHLLLQVTR